MEQYKKEFIEFRRLVLSHETPERLGSGLNV